MLIYSSHVTRNKSGSSCYVLVRSRLRLCVDCGMKRILHHVSYTSVLLHLIFDYYGCTELRTIVCRRHSAAAADSTGEVVRRTYCCTYEKRMRYTLSDGKRNSSNETYKQRYTKYFLKQINSLARCSFRGKNDISLPTFLVRRRLATFPSPLQRLPSNTPSSLALGGPSRCACHNLQYPFRHSAKPLAHFRILKPK